MTKIAEIRKKSEIELMATIADLRTELVEKRRSLHAGELQNPLSIKTVRRDIARCLTLLASAAQVKPEGKEKK